MNPPPSTAELVPPVAARPRVGNYRWLICALLFLATTINYIDRQILSLVKEMFDREIGWTNQQFGWVNGAFQLAYCLGLLGFGWAIDRYGVKLGYALSITWWSLAAMAHALVGGFTGFLSARVGLGLGEGGNFPSAIKAVAVWFPRGERAFATSIFNTGASVGPIVAPLIVPWVAYNWGWRSAYLAAGALGFLWLVLWLPFYNAPEKVRSLTPGELAYIRRDADATFASRRIPWSSLFKYRQTWAFIVAKFLTDPVWWFFLIWLPDFFNKTRGLEIKKSWLHLATIYAIVTVLGIAGGWLTGHLIQRGWTVTRARKTGMFIAALCVLPILLVTLAGNWTAVLLIGLAGAAHQAWSANLFTTVSDIFPREAVASVVGLGGMVGSLGGFLFPIFTGWLLDRFENLGQPATGYGILFAICASAYLVAFALNHWLAPKFQPLLIPD